MSTRIGLRRAYEPPGPEDGQRVLVDRLWPRGVSREAAHLDDWLREVAPDNGLRRWFGHRVERWPEFRLRYLADLIHGAARPALDGLVETVRQGPVTLVYGARDPDHNQAVVLRDAITAGLAGGLPPPRPDLQAALADLPEQDLAALERAVRGRLAAAGRDEPADVLLVATLPAYVDALTSGLCHEGAVEVFDDALERATRPART